MTVTGTATGTASAAVCLAPSAYRAVIRRCFHYIADVDFKGPNARYSSSVNSKGWQLGASICGGLCDTWFILVAVVIAGSPPADSAQIQVQHERLGAVSASVHY